MSDDGLSPMLQALGTDARAGLTTAQVEANRKRFGPNSLTPPDRTPLWKQYLEKFRDPTIITLCACAGLAILAGIYKSAIGEHGTYLEGVAILAAVVIATGVGFWSEYKANQAFELLRQETENVLLKLTRDGRFQTVSSRDLVVGDIVHLEGGDKIPADGLLVHESGLYVDQSMFTGEPEPQRKRREENPQQLEQWWAKRAGDDSLPMVVMEERNHLVALSDVTDGHGRMVVTAVGDHSTAGKFIRELGEQERDRTPLEQRLDHLASVINVAGTAAAALIFTAMLCTGLLRGDFGDLGSTGRTAIIVAFLAIVFAIPVISIVRKGVPVVRLIVAGWALVLAIGLGSVFVWAPPDAITFHYLLTTILGPTLKFFIVAITIIVVAVPEGLPMAITISLALSMRNIRKDNNLVRKMVAAETVGSATVICSDKTGTLTLNRMSVAEIYIHGRSLAVEDSKVLAEDASFERLSLSCAVNSTAHLETKAATLKFVGSHTEGALLKWLSDRGVQYETVREETAVVDQMSFSSERKMMATLADTGGKRIALTKGAPDRVLELCVAVETPTGTEPISEHAERLASALDEMGSRGLRSLALAYRYVDGEADSDWNEALTLLALVGIEDPVRPDVRQAIATCHRAGIDVKMVTGDSDKTATRVAESLGMLDAAGVVITGPEFQAMGDEEARALMPRLRILARSSPQDKRRLVELLQANGEVVAVTGDGTNDALALKRADVGISMGLRGTDIAKEASDIVLTDDNFGSIVRAVHWGRTLYENVQKFIQFQLTINLSALAIAFLSPLLAAATAMLGIGGVHFRELPLTVLQLLWINLIMDTLAALALSLEPPRDELMRDAPRSRTEPFITGTMAANILVMATYFTVVNLVLQATDVVGEGWTESYKNSFLFTTYVFFQVFNAFNARSVVPGRSPFAGVLQSRMFLAIVALIVVVQVGVTTFGGAVFGTEPLRLDTWVLICALTSTALVVGALFRGVASMLRSRKASLVPADRSA